MSSIFHREHSKTVLIGSILLFACAAVTIWLGASFMLQDYPSFTLGNVWGALHIIVAAFYIIAGFFILQPDNLQMGTILALFLGLIMTLWFSMTGAFGIALVFEGVIPLIIGLFTVREQKESRRRIWIRRITNFWYDFSHNKIGIAGLAILMVYVAVAFLQPIVATHDPETRSLAERFAMPEWVGILNPGLANLPRTTHYNLDWNYTNLPDNVVATMENNTWRFDYTGNLSDGPVTVPLTTKFNYQYDPPETFYYLFRWGASPLFNDINVATARYSLELNLTLPSGTTLPVWDQHWWRFKGSYCFLPNPYYTPGVDPYDRVTYPGRPEYESYWKVKEFPWSSNYTIESVYNLYADWGIPIPTWDTQESNVSCHYTVTYEPCTRLGFDQWETEKMTALLFSEVGEYTLQLYITFEPREDNGSCTVSVTDIDVHVPGLLWGLMGTEVQGRDVWSRIVYGARVSLAVGITAALLSVSLGILVGVVSGYYGGIIDEGLMRLVDILLCLPVLPLLLVLVALFGRSILYIILIIAIFGWQGLSRVIRSQVLSLREMPFIECAKASGASPSYVMFRHLVPNVMPIAMASLILSIPGAILLEAALSFIGFGDPRTPTWGREFAYMQETGVRPAEHWWWVLPPGLAITFLCVAFVFIGHAIDEIINPKLRRRR